jgi:hypothetical protein
LQERPIKKTWKVYVIVVPVDPALGADAPTRIYGVKRTRASAETIARGIHGASVEKHYAD